MSVPKTTPELLDLLRKSNLVESARLNAFVATHPEGFGTPLSLCAKLRADGLLTSFHTEQLQRGKYRGFFLGKYKILDRIGLGGMGQVFLAEHTVMRRRVALKVLPPDRAENHYSRERFLREARAAGQLDHPNLVRAFDYDAESEVIFLVMEYVDGVSFQDLVTRAGPLAPARAAHYLLQSAHGLAYLNSFGLVHRDIKPANLLVDRQGVVKILDLGLVRSEIDEDNLTRGEGVRILGTADYLAPEQAIDCTKVDVRADIYGLGATAYYLLTGRPPFEGDKVAQKLLAHQVKPVKPVHELRPDVPVALSELVTRMLAKKPEDRFPSPAELIGALEPLVTEAPAPPSDEEIPATASSSYGQSGSVNLSGPRVGRGAGSSVGASSTTSGSAIRYHSDSKLNPESVRAEVLQAITPAPAPSPLRTPAAIKAQAFLPPTVSAAASHGKSPAARADGAAIELPEMFRRPAPGSQPSTTPPRRKAGKSVALVVAFAVVLAAGLYVTLTMGGSRGNASPPPQPAARQAAAPAK